MDNYQEEYYYANLAVKNLRDELSDDEKIELFNWVDQDPSRQILLNALSNEQNLCKELDFLNSIDKKSGWNDLLSKKFNQPKSIKIYSFIKKWKYAAIAILALSTILLVYKLNINNKAELITAKIVKNDIPPGKDGAIVTLANGQKILFDGKSNGLKQSNLNSLEEKDGFLVYNSLPSSNKNGYNTITTPIANKYKIKLPDGTLVWLNSSSTLKFANTYNKQDRRVFLTGEAYFEVSKNKLKPFKVFSKNAVVQVLGTHFNIKAYSDEPELKATLIEGSIKILNNNKSRMVLPGQQASILQNKRNITITQASIDESIAWKNNIFLFENEDIENVMRKVSRWYNVEIDYHEELPTAHFTGKISRENNISQILNMLELTGGVHFKLENRKIIVTK